ncbi:DUF222 domain-containing protein [Mycobacterium leprae]|uniref:DUF222 domain-containing protein n=1 Tax=Mycobacterium leprae TaxID=1769 RepID=UPI003F6684E6
MPSICKPGLPITPCQRRQRPIQRKKQQPRTRDSHTQRQHNALTALDRGQLGDPKLGVYNGLPVTVIV